MAVVGIIMEAPLEEIPSNWALTTLPVDVMLLLFSMAAQYKVPPFESPRPMFLIRRTESVTFVPVAFTTLILDTEGLIANEGEPVGAVTITVV